MEKNDSKKTRKRGNTGKVRIAFSSMIAFLLFLAEIYLMIHSADYIEGLVTVTVLLLAVIYILVTSILQVNYEKDQSFLDEIDDIFDSEKATYLLMRKNFEEFNERLAFLEDNVKTPTEEIIAAQKAIAKVTISRNKENTDALMNSNDKMLEKIFNFEDMMVKNNNRLIEQQQSMLSQMSKEIDLRLKELEFVIKNELLQVSINPSQMSVMTPQAQDMQTEDNNFVPDMNVFDDMEPEIEIPEEAEDLSADVIMDNLAEAADNDIEEPIESIDNSEESAGILEGLMSEPLDALDTFMDQPADNIESLIGEPTLENLDALLEEPIEGLNGLTEEPLDAFDDLIMEEAEPSDIPVEASMEEPLEEAAEEPVAEENPPMPDLSNPNKMMTPEEIAALLANL